MIDNFIESQIFIKRLKFLKKSQFHNKNQIKKYQTSEFLKILRYAVKNVDFYKKYFKKNKCRKVKSINDKIYILVFKI